jgi:hypothetical protein
VPHSSIKAPLNPNGVLAIQVRDVGSAIGMLYASAKQCRALLNLFIAAYVLSTLAEHIPSKKYLILAGAFTQFCRLAHVDHRPERVHIFWPTNSNPIILINDASIYIRDPQCNSPDGYREITLDYLLSSPGLNAHHVNAMPDCDCSQIIPAIWYVPPTSLAHKHTASTFCLRSLNDGQHLQFFSADFARLHSLLRFYKKEGGRSTSFKTAARPACDTCRTLMSTFGLLYEDLVSNSAIASSA